LQADLHDNLVAVRKLRRAYCVLAAQYLGVYKAGSGVSTRKRNELSEAGKRIDAARIRYQQAWERMSRLDSNGSWLQKYGLSYGKLLDTDVFWRQRYQRLERKDIRGPNPGDDQTDLAAVRKPRARDQHVGRYIQSWIWTSINADDEPVESVRVQWAKMTANAERWEEERALVPEEMRRTLASFEHEASFWDSQLQRGGNLSSPLSQALDAYAKRQAAIWRRRIDLFAHAWLPILRSARLGSDWTSPYALAIQTTNEEARRLRENTATARSSTTHEALTGNIVEDGMTGSYCDTVAFRSSPL
jgi:hypothetical protein